MNSEALVEGLLGGQRRALARLLSRLESGSADVVRDAVRRLHPHTGRAAFVGVTGASGAGKSTLVSAMVRAWRARGCRVGVLAIDPTSPFSGGALLGDRVRMQDHALDDAVFIRSMASRGRLGGLSWATPQALLALDAAGYDPVVLETVGVGQAEVEVAAVADTTVVVLAPGMGDAIQAAKAGILEVADVFCVNKADREGARRALADLREMQRLGHGAWIAPIVATVATRGEGIDDLVEAIARHRDWLVAEGGLRERRIQRARLQIRELALGRIRERVVAVSGRESLDELANDVTDRKLDPYAAADRLLEVLSPSNDIE